MWEEQGFSTLPSSSSESPNELHKVLGMSWDTKLDILTMEVKGLLEFLDLEKNTKRFVLQAAGRIFDPVGLISWDDELPSDIQETWKQWSIEIPELANLQIPRNVFQISDHSDFVLELHAFADASPKAYGAAISLRIKTANQVTVNLVASKSRVAPLKRISLPRLELIAALLASRLAREVKKVLDRKGISSIYYWTDSQITLYWIKGSIYKWKPFVANRVKEIQSLTDRESWNHFAGCENPADLVTRGISCKSLIENVTWWTGPDFLKELVIPKCDETLNIPETDLPCEELKKCSVPDPKDIQSVSLITTNDRSFLEQILNLSNSFVKLIRILSFIFRFIHNCRNPISRNKGFLTIEENKHAENWLLLSLQSGKFQEEFKRLKQGEPVSSRSKLSCLNVFLDENSLIRVGGRLRNSDLSNSKFPIVLPSKHKLTDVILNHYHLKYFHLGAHALLFQV
nr:uncharacterized protein LOC122272307 [Parasteatoda tepidariorum]